LRKKQKRYGIKKQKKKNKMIRKAGFKDSGKFLKSTMSMSGDDIISGEDVFREINMLNALSPMMNQENILFMDPLLVDALKKKKNSDIEKRTNDTASSDNESTVYYSKYGLQEEKVTIPFFKTFRTSDLNIANMLCKHSSVDPLSHSVMCFPCVIGHDGERKNDRPAKKRNASSSSSFQMCDHFVLFIVYIDINKIVMYDSLIDDEITRKKEDNDFLSDDRDLEGLVSIERIRKNEFKHLDMTTFESSIRETFHVIENFFNALHVLKIREAYESNINVGRNRKKYSATEDDIALSRIELKTFSFFVDSYPIKQKGLECGMFVMSGMLDFMIGWPDSSDHARKNGVYRMKMTLTDKCSTKSRYYPDIKTRYEKMLFSTPTIKYSVYVSLIVNSAIQSITRNYNKPHPLFKEARTILLLGSCSSKRGEVDYILKDVSIYKEILSVFDQYERSHKRKQMRLKKLYGSGIGSFSGMNFFPDLYVHSKFLQTKHAKSVDEIVKALDNKKIKEAVVWIFPSNPEDCNNELQKNISKAIKRTLLSIHYLIIVIPGICVKIIYTDPKDRNYIKNKTGKVFELVYYLQDKATHMKRKYVPDVSQLVDVLISNSMKSNECFNTTIELPSIEADSLSWLRACGGWLPFAVQKDKTNK